MKTKLKSADNLIPNKQKRDIFPSSHVTLCNKIPRSSMGEL